jgi:hypothetical protein
MSDAKCSAEQRHQWDADGERCVKCGDKDWMAGPVCHGRIESPAEQEIKPHKCPHGAWNALDCKHCKAGPSAVEEVETEYNPAGNDPDEVAWVPAELALRHAEALDRLRAENELFRTAGIAEIASRNPAVLEYCKHWEGRAERAEAALRGGVVVPQEPTPEMIQAWHDRAIEGADYIDRNSIEYALYVACYKAMLAASKIGSKK